MPDPQPDLPALVGSRICHDLISPLGAIANGLELMTMAGDDQSPELALVSESVANATSRIKVFRIAFGVASADQTVGAKEVRAILDDLSASARVRYEWQGSGDVARNELKSVFLLMLCLESSMPYGGTVSIEAREGRWHMTAASARTRSLPEMWEIAAGRRDTDGVDPATVHFGLVGPALEAAGRRLEIEMTEQSITLDF
jgi:histidine phosphotransferase ChpT